MSDTIEDILFATLEVGDDPFTPMAQVHQVATRWVEQDETLEVLASLDDLMDHEAMRVRMICLIAMRTMGEKGLACDRDVYRRVTLAGLKDEKPIVRAHAARLAGSFATRGGEIDAALAAMIADLGAPESGSQEEKALQRAREASAEIESRATTGGA